MGIKAAGSAGLFVFSFSSVGLEKKFNLRRGWEFCFIFHQTKLKKEYI